MKRSKKLSLGIVCALFALFVLFGFLSAEEDGSFTGYSSTQSEEELYNATNA